jgi:hypothetical protein
MSVPELVPDNRALLLATKCSLLLLELIAVRACGDSEFIVGQLIQPTVLREAEFQQVLALTAEIRANRLTCNEAWVKKAITEVAQLYCDEMQEP